MTRSEIHAETGVATDADWLLMREMRRLKLAHRCGWIGREDGAGSPAEVLKFGRGTDAPRPRILTDKERQKAPEAQAREADLASVARAIAGQGALPKLGAAVSPDRSRSSGMTAENFDAVIIARHIANLRRIGPLHMRRD